MFIPFGEVRISPVPLPWALTASSTDNFQMGRLSTNWVASVDCAGVNSMMKSAKTYPFTIVLCLYLMSNSLISRYSHQRQGITSRVVRYSHLAEYR